MAETFDTRVLADVTWGTTCKDDGGALHGQFPQDSRHANGRPVVVAADEVLRETALHEAACARPPRGEPFTSRGTGVWAEPHSVRGTREVVLADGSKVTYRWNRFVGQQVLVEEIHRAWPIDRDDVPPGMEAAFVPIVVHQDAATSRR